MLKTIFTLSFVSLSAITANAAVPCNIISSNCFDMPEAVKQAFPAFADRFNLNPANLPQFPSPYGLEAIASTSGKALSKPQLNLGLIKTFRNFGMGASTNAENTFYAYDLYQSYRGLPSKSIIDQRRGNEPIITSVNFGTSVAPMPKGIKKYFSPSFAGSAHYRTSTNRWSPKVGTAFSLGVFNFGASRLWTSAETKTGFPATTTDVAHAGIRLWKLNVEYAYMSYKTESASFKNRALFSKPAQFITATYNFKKLALTAAYRTNYNFDGRKTYLFLGVVQIQLSRKIAIAALYNYLPGTTSFGFQGFL